jgi:hypothetical protein
MRPTQTPAGRPDSRQPTRDHRRESNSPSSIGPGAHNLSLPLPSDEEFLSRFGDTIDDRVAEILDELLTERSSARPHWRLHYLLGGISLILAAVAVSILAWLSAAAWMIWPATAVVCLATAWISSASARHGSGRR